MVIEVGDIIDGEQAFDIADTVFCINDAGVMCNCGAKYEFLGLNISFELSVNYEIDDMIADDLYETESSIDVAYLRLV